MVGSLWQFTHSIRLAATMAASGGRRCLLLMSSVVIFLCVSGISTAARPTRQLQNSFQNGNKVHFVNYVTDHVMNIGSASKHAVISSTSGKSSGPVVLAANEGLELGLQFEFVNLEVESGCRRFYE